MDVWEAINEKPTLDENILRQLYQEMGESKETENGMLAILLGDYREDAVKQVDEIRRGVAQLDFKLMQRAAHTLKANSALFGALRLSALARQVEEMGRAGTLEGVSAWVLQIESELEKVLDALPSL